MKTAGKEVFVKVNTGTEGSPVWTKVGGQKSAEFPRSTETIEVTDKDSQGWKEFLVGNKGWEISFESFLVEDDAGMLAIESAYDSGVEKQFQFITKTGTYMGKAIVTEFSITGEEGDAAVISFSLQGTSSIVKS